MKASGPATVFLCGPRAGGNSDTAGLTFAEGLARLGLTPRIIRLREHAIRPCRGCGACAAGPKHACPLADDDAEALFAALGEASVLAFASPIYFYHLPAHFKAWIDRAQRHYARRVARDAAGESPLPVRTAQVLLVAGRREGRQLFTGSLLTLQYFLWPFFVRLEADPCLLRGLDAPSDLRADPTALEALRVRGARAGLAAVPGAPDAPDATDAPGRRQP